MKTFEFLGRGQETLRRFFGERIRELRLHEDYGRIRMKKDPYTVTLPQAPYKSP